MGVSEPLLLLDIELRSCSSWALLLLEGSALGLLDSLPLDAHMGGIVFGAVLRGV